MSAPLLLFVGGIRSGKSSLALRWTERQAEKCLFVAGCVPRDAEMAARVAGHKAERGLNWECLEEGLEPQKALQSYFSSSESRGAEPPGALLFDCVSMWVANMLEAGLTQEDGLLRVRSFLKYLGGLRLPAALVSMEAGLGLVASGPVGRRFQDMLGLVNQELAGACRTVVFVSCGLPLALKGVLPRLQ